MRTMLRRLLRWLGVALGVVGMACVVGGGLAAGSSGTYGALIGWLLGVLFAGADIAVMWATSQRSVTGAMGAMVLGWVVKMAVVVAVTIPVRSAQGLSTVAYAVAVMATLVVTIVVEMIVVAKARSPYVDAAPHRKNLR